jgi:hypothetical protein
MVAAPCEHFCHRSNFIGTGSSHMNFFSDMTIQMVPIFILVSIQFDFDKLWMKPSVALLDTWLAGLQPKKDRRRPSNRVPPADFPAEQKCFGRISSRLSAGAKPG